MDERSCYPRNITMDEKLLCTPPNKTMDEKLCNLPNITRDEKLCILPNITMDEKLCNPPNITMDEKFCHPPNITMDEMSCHPPNITMDERSCDPLVDGWNFSYQWMNKMSCDHPYITRLLMDEKLCNPHLNEWKYHILRPILDDDAWCIGNKRVRQYGGLVNLEWMTNQKLENLWTRVRLCVTCKMLV